MRHYFICTGVDLNTTVAQLMKTALVGGSLLSEIGTIIGSIGRGGDFDLSKFGFQEYLSRGTTFKGITKWVESFDSSSLSLGSGFEESDIDSLTKQSEEKAKKSVEGSDESENIGIKDLWELFTSVIGENATDSMRVTIVNDSIPVTWEASSTSIDFPPDK